eukprot:2971491-Pleurochrysis_carterae.AAC.4
MKRVGTGCQIAATCLRAPLISTVHISVALKWRRATGTKSSTSPRSDVSWQISSPPSQAYLAIATDSMWASKPAMLLFRFLPDYSGLDCPQYEFVLTNHEDDSSLEADVTTAAETRATAAETRATVAEERADATAVNVRTTSGLLAAARG